MKLNNRILVGIVVIGSIVSGQAMARKASQLTDLVGAKGSSGESALESRGFTYITGHKGEYDTSHSYWWNASDKNCIHVQTYDGRYSDIDDSPKSDCNQKGDNNAAAMAAVVGLAAIAVIASHKSDHHKDGNHYPNQNDDSTYERGYNDGLYNSAYHNYDRSDAYSSGYQAGVDQRSNNTSQHYGHGGYAQVGAFADLNGARAAGADSTLTSRGFKNVDAFKSANTSYTIWSRRDSHQCVQMTVAEGQVVDIRDIGSHPKCR